MSTKSGIIHTSGPLKGDAGEYWEGSVKRTELQDAIDIQDKFIMRLMEAVFGVPNADGTPDMHFPGMQTTVSRMDFVIAFIMEKLNITPQDVQDFMKRKAEEFIAKEKANPTPAPAEGPKLVVEG